jgi:hypothetical protein
MFIAGQATSRHCGCRILHEVAIDTVVLRIHAGTMPGDPARDEPVQFMLTVPDVDTLIEFLGGVREEMAAGDVAAGKVIQLHRRKEHA